MHAAPRLLVPFVILLSLAHTHGDAFAAKAKPKPKRVTIGQLVMEEIPAIPAALAERLVQYQNVRSASFRAWSASGKGMLIATRFAETSQLHHVAAPGGDRQQLTFFREPVGGGAVDPKQPDKGLFFSMDVGGNEFHQYYWLDLTSGKHTLVTDGKSRNESLVVSNGGGRAAFVSTRRNNKDFDVYVVDGTDAASAKLVKEVSGQWNVADWSPDDKRLLLTNYISINESYVHVLDLDSGELTQVNAGATGKVAYSDPVFARGKKQHGVYYASDEDGEFRALVYQDLTTGKKQLLRPDLKWDVEQVAVSRDGKSIAFAVNENGRAALYLGATAAPGKARKIALPTGVLTSGLRFDPASKRLGFSLSTADSSSDAWAVDVASGKATRWTTSEVGGLDRSRFVAPEEIEFESFDGKKIPGWIYRPKGAKGPVPVVISIHGGPEAQSTTRFSSTVQYWVLELGVAVIFPNLRGSTGYGKTYVTLDNGKLREDSVKDIGALLDWVAADKTLDAKKVCVQGGSYGGYMVLASLVHFGDRLRCGIDNVGISNFVTFLTNTESYRRDLRRAEYGDEQDASMRTFLESISPTTNAKKIVSPLFVVQGANDPRVPASEAEQIVATVRNNGNPVWYLLAKDEGHGFQKKSNSDFYLAAMVMFLEENLLR